MVESRGQQTFSGGPDGKYCGLCRSHSLFGAALAVAVDGTEVNAPGYVPIKLYYKNRWQVRFGPQTPGIMAGLLDFELGFHLRFKTHVITMWS